MRTLITALVFSALSFASDINGNWTATAEGPNGTMTRTYTFKVDGKKLTGETVSSMVGKSTIEDGKIDGDDLSFTIVAKFQDNEIKIAYKGKVIGKDEIKLNSENPNGSMEWIAKRVTK